MAIMNLRIIVNRGEAVMWLPADMEKIYPAALAKLEMSPETIIALTALLNNNGKAR
jgi:hypothetical protein